MSHAWEFIKTSLKDAPESGQDLAEYGLLVGFIALIVIAGAILFGQGLLQYFTNLAGTIATW